MTIYFSTNIPEMRSVLSYNRISNEIANSTRRLETGQRINTAQDDPTGLIIRETMRADIKGIQSAQKNVAQANSMLSIAENGMKNISSLLMGTPGNSDNNGLLGLINDQTLSSGEKKSMISDILDAIDGVVRSTTYNGRQIINGAFAYNYSGVQQSRLTGLRINKANVATGGSDVKIDLQQKADHARLALNFDEFNNSSGINPKVIEAGTTITIEFQNQARVEYTFEKDTEIVADDPIDSDQILASDLVGTLNNLLRGSGVTAMLDDEEDPTLATAIVFESNAVGSDQILEITTSGASATDLAAAIVAADVSSGNSYYDLASSATTVSQGADAVVRVNGKETTAEGLNLLYADSDLSFTTSLSNSFAKANGEDPDPTDTTTFKITGGGAMFQMGKDVVSDLQLRLGIPSVGTGYLGGSNGVLAGLRNIDYDSDAGLQQAYSIVNDAINSLAKSRAQIGLSQNVLSANTDNLDSLLTTVTEAEGKISNTDTAVESSRLARNELLAQMAMSSILYSRQFASFSVSSLFR